MAAQNVGSLVINLEARVAQLQGDMAATKRVVSDAMDTVERDAKRGAKALEDAAGSAGMLARAGAAIAGGFALSAVKDGVVSVAAALNQAQIASERLQKSLFYANGGDVRAIASDIEWLRRQASGLGLDFAQASASYAQFAGAVKGTPLAPYARQVFDSLSTAASAFGLSAETAQGAMLALVQMSAKGVVSAEEFRGQLAEHLPVATQAAARALGVTTGEFSKMLESGQLLAADFLPKFAAELKRMSADAAAFGGETQKASANFVNSWEAMKTEVAQSGIASFIAGQLAILTDAFDDVSESMRRARKEGSGFWGQTMAGGGAVMRFLNPVNALHYDAQSDNARMAQLKERIKEGQAGLYEYSFSQTLAQKQAGLAAMRSELAELEKRAKAATTDAAAGAKAAEAKAAARKDAEARAKKYADDDSRLNDREEFDKKVRKEEEAFKGAVVGLEKGSAAYLAAERAHQTAVSKLRDDFDKKQAAERKRAGAQGRREDAAIDAMQREIMGVEKLSAVERARYEIAEGKYAGWSAASQARLLALAAELDATRQVRAENKKFLDELNRDVEQYETHQRDVARRLRGGEYDNAAQRLQSEHRERSLDIQYNAGLSDQEKQQYGQQEDRRNERAVDALRSSERQGIGLQSEEQQLRDQYDRRHQLIMDATTLSETERADYIRRNQEQLNLDLMNMERNRASAMLSSSSQLFDGLAGLAATFKGKNSGIYKAMFAMSKAFAIADSVIKIQQAVATAAASAPWPANIGAMSSVVSATAGLVSTIASTNLSGMAHDGIDNVPREGTWLLDKGERVVDRRTNGDLKDFLTRVNAAQSAPATPAQPVKVVVNNLAPGTAARTEERQGAGGEREILVLVERVIDNKLARSMRPDGDIYNFVRG
ncbi:tape measure protein [Chromobacterium subtsugae]|uniref:tape measure protein n=1 Tax=Chromobacterium subtsugae TaxID=251747 RepID=UPI0006414A15|nr:tape measure protein [Chromobacterium subtsugae]